MMGALVAFVAVCGLAVLQRRDYATAALASQAPRASRVFLHIADTHADPFYDYTQFWRSAANIGRNPDLYSNKAPATTCGKFSESVASILAHWNATGADAMGRGGGPACPCGQGGANPPYSVLASLQLAIAAHEPEFVLWGGDFASHYEPGTNERDACDTAKNSAKASVSLLSARAGARTGRPIQHLWGWGNNDVLPKRQPLTQAWLEDFGAHLLHEGWLRAEEYEGTWKLGGFYKRHLGGGLCAIILNSNSWTAHQIQEEHHRQQLEWLSEQAFADAECREFVLNAHVPLGWLEGGEGHHQWDNLAGAEVTEYSDLYREVLDRHATRIVAELYGHINKADVRLMSAKPNQTDADRRADALSRGEPTSDSARSDPVGDLDEDVGSDAQVVSFTVAGISRRGMNDPQFQRVTLDPRRRHGIRDISVFSMKRAACGAGAFTFAYSFRELFAPDFNGGINVHSLKDFVEHDQLQRERVESHLALTSMPYGKQDLKDAAFLEAVRAGKTGC